MVPQNLIDRFEHFFIDQKSADSEVARRIAEFVPKAKWSIIDYSIDEERGALSRAEFDRSKKTIYVTPFKGKFFKRCPGSKPGLLCCNYFVLNLGVQCDMNCSYCYLQSFINSRYLTIYSNIDDALAELSGFESADTINLPLRVGTGETVDSLSLDSLTRHSVRLIDFFRAKPNWTLEFKTKSDSVDALINIESIPNAIVSWSINPEFIVDSEEHGTATLSKRFEAARRCIDHGYKVAFHIDPMIWHPEWRDNYSQLAKQIQTLFDPSEVATLSVGALRFQPEQRNLMRERFGMNSWVTKAEVYKSRDGKMRYDSKLRQEMIELVLGSFRKHSENWKAFICMETPETWVNTETPLPQKTDGLKNLFDARVSQAFV